MANVIKLKSKRLTEIRQRKEDDLKLAEERLASAERDLMGLAQDGAPEHEIRDALRRLDLARDARRHAQAALREPPVLRPIMIDAAGQAWVRARR